MEPKHPRAWLVKRLQDEAELPKLAALIEASDARLRAMPLAELLPPALWKREIQRIWSPELARALTQSAAELGLELAYELGAQERQPIGRWLNPASRQRLLDLAARKRLIDPDWIDALLAQEMAEELLAETLYRTLIDFSTLVPRIVQNVMQSVMPSGLGRLASLGGRAAGGIGGIGSRIFEEVESRLGSEVKRYLERGTRRALDSLGEFAKQRIDTPAALASRRGMVVFALDKSEAFHMRQFDIGLRRQLADLVGLIGESIVQNEGFEARAAAVIDRLNARFEGQSLGEALTERGLDTKPPYEVWAALLWPIYREWVATEAVQDWLLALCVDYQAAFAE